MTHEENPTPINPEEVAFGERLHTFPSNSLFRRVHKEDLSATYSSFLESESTDYHGKVLSIDASNLSRVVELPGEIDREFMRVEWDWLGNGFDWEDGEIDIEAADSDFFKSDNNECERHPTFQLAHRLKLMPDTDQFKLYHADIARHRGLIHTEHKLKFWEDRFSGIKSLNFTDVFNDQNCDFYWDESGKLYIAQGVTFGPRQLFRDYWKIRFNDDGTPSLESDEGDYNYHFGYNKPASIVLNGKVIRLEANEQEIIISMIRKKYPSVLDYSLTIPRFQPTETYTDNQGNSRSRFAFMDDLIPLPLQKDPSIPTGPIDNVWMRTDLRDLLGIKVLKNNPDPTTLKDELIRY